jgi:hypothetical protein
LHADCNGLQLIVTDCGLIASLIRYPALYSSTLGAIIQSSNDIITCIPKKDRDVVILEEPEHLNWYHHGARWTDEFGHVVGIAHTNYLQYARYNTEGVVKSGAPDGLGLPRIASDCPLLMSSDEL